MALGERPENRMESMFPRLTGPPGGISPRQIAEDQKARLEAAMLDAVGRHGYVETTVRELVTVAGVSKSTFYNHFKDKRECFLATFDEIVDRLSERMGTAYRGPTDFRERLLAALTVFMCLAVDEPAAVYLIAVDVLTLGVAGVEHRERASQRFEVLLRQSLAQSSPAETMPPTTARAVIAGIRGVAYWRLRAGEEKELPDFVDPLVDWALSYQRPEGELTRLAAAAAAEPAPPPPPRDDSLPDWREPPDSPLSRRTLTQRQRIVRAAGRVVFERGYEALSIPAISGAAGVSNQTFYEHFSNKRDAFLAAFEELVGETIAATATAFAAAGDRPEAIGIGIRAMLEHIASDEVFAKIAFFELAAAGPAALDSGDAVLDGFTAFLRPGTVPSEFAGALPDVVREAIGSGIWGVLQYELSHGRLRRLPDLAPEVTRLALMPLEAR
jgi:AcrR family transcriptional regulator